MINYDNEANEADVYTATKKFFLFLAVIGFGVLTVISVTMYIVDAFTSG